MPHDSSRPTDGTALPTACPDCGVRPLVAEPDPQRHAPRFHHDPTCPISRDEDRMISEDVQFLAGRGPGAVRVRGLSRPELAAYAQIGRPIPQRLRRAVEVHVSQLAPDRLLRRVEYAGVTRGMVIVHIRAGAQR